MNLLSQCTGVVYRPPHDPLAAGRRHVWYDRDRNGLITELTRAFVQRDILRLHGLGVLPHAHGWTPAPPPRPVQATVVAESIEHAEALACHLNAVDGLQAGQVMLATPGQYIADRGMPVPDVLVLAGGITADQLEPLMGRAWPAHRPPVVLEIGELGPRRSRDDPASSAAPATRGAA